jgi:hypothetical protein
VTSTSFPAGLAVALYNEIGLLDRRPADDEADAIRVTVEIIRERSGLRVGERIEIQPLNTVRYAPLGSTSAACAEVREWQRERREQLQAAE